jgi:hypothetical protein
MFSAFKTTYVAAACAALLGCASAGSSSPNRTEATVVECRMKPAAQGYAGTCAVPCVVNALGINFEGRDATRACVAAPRSVDAALARTDVAHRWLGTMQGVQPEDPTRFEIVPNKSGAGSVARTPFGWFTVLEMRESDQSLSLSIDAGRQVRPDQDDLAIIKRATDLIPTTEKWNKQDNRQCVPGAQKLSLFCALTQATNEISGGVHYRQPAMQAVREELNLVDASRIRTHRIMDYNNHPSTTLEEIHALRQRAKAKVERETR